MDGKSLDITQENLKQLQAIFPQVFTEGKIDFKRLQDLLGGDSLTAQEFYALNWAGKSESRKEIQKQTTATLIPEPERSINFDTTQNIFIEGENLEVLRTLQKSYFGKIKMIYIDPPYNTGNDSFVYPDDYSERLDEYKKRTGETDEEGFLNKQDLWKKNTKESGQYHSTWLSMMYPRLYLARNLMREDGVIFISIDDNEQANLKLLCDEIFGEENFVANVIWEKNFAPKNDAKYLSDNHDHILIYARNKEVWRPTLLPRSEEANARYSNPDNDPRGDWTSGDLSVKTYSKEYDYPITTPSGKVVTPPKGGCWRVSKDKFEELVADNRITFGENGSNTPRLKRFLSEVKDGMTSLTIWKRDEVGDNQEARREIRNIFDDVSFFDTPKPTKLIKKILQLSTVPTQNDIVLDFFAGSATTAHAVIDLNNEDGGNRSYIMVQIPESVEIGSEAHKAGYNTIADISRARVSKVIEKIVTEANGKLALQESKPDLGFQSYRLAPSNFKKWDGNVSGDQIIEQLKLHIDSVNPAAEKEAMLRELLLKAGKPITSKAETVTTTEGDFYHLPEFNIVVCLNGYGKDTEEKIIALAPVQIIVIDKFFERDDALSNARNTMREAGIDKFTVI